VGSVPFLGLPGNPVSAAVTFDVFARPAILALAGRPDNALYVQATLAKPMPSDGRRTYARVRLERLPDGGWLAHSTGTQSSGALSSLVYADGLLIMSEGTTEALAGKAFPVRVFNELGV
jgi:molybdopterin molybdotransferase